MSTNYAPHEQRVIAERDELNKKINDLNAFIGGSPVFDAQHPHDAQLLRDQLSVMVQYSAILGQRIARFAPQAQHPAVAAMQPLSNDGTPAADPDDFPLGKACDLSGDGTCEACQ